MGVNYRGRRGSESVALYFKSEKNIQMKYIFFLLIIVTSCTSGLVEIEDYKSYDKPSDYKQLTQGDFEISNPVSECDSAVMQMEQPYFTSYIINSTTRWAMFGKSSTPAHSFYKGLVPSTPHPNTYNMTITTGQSNINNAFYLVDTAHQISEPDTLVFILKQHRETFNGVYNNNSISDSLPVTACKEWATIGDTIRQFAIF